MRSEALIPNAGDERGNETSQPDRTTQQRPAVTRGVTGDPIGSLTRLPTKLGRRPRALP